jgi:DNA-binding XRE family transcriptional regulator
MRGRLHLKNISHLREERGISLKQLASFVGISRSHLSAIEKGVTDPSTTLSYQIATVLHCSIEDMIGKDHPLTYARTHGSLSQERLAFEARVPLETIIKCENENIAPPLLEALRIASCLGEHPHSLFYCCRESTKDAPHE